MSREFREDRAFIRAVVSLPQETFYSAGASVKASLLFMQKFTTAQAADYEAKREKAINEVDIKYGPEIDAERERIQKVIDAANNDIKRVKPLSQSEKKKTTTEQLKAAEAAAKEAAKSVPGLQQAIAEANRELRDYEKRMVDQKRREARQLLKQWFDYPIFLYDAQHVGITATGEQDACEAVPERYIGSIGGDETSRYGSGRVPPIPCRTQCVYV